MEMRPPVPLMFEPLLKPKPWGGRRLAEMFGKPLPAHTLVGESWEIASLPEGESHVRDGPLRGVPLAAIVAAWGRALLGSAALVGGRFPLLIKFLDARENLSVQVHPKPGAAASLAPALKHEAWFVIDAAPDARVFIGLCDGVQPDDAARAAGRADFVQLLRSWPARPGDCFYLPSGTPHALGAGIVVAEIQTPSDVTYRLYDWDRAADDGVRRELHIEAGLANMRFDVAPREILQSGPEISDATNSTMRLARCDSFTIDRVRLAAGATNRLPQSEMSIWIVISGRGTLSFAGQASSFRAGDSIVFPAENEALSAHADSGCELLEVRIPPSAAGGAAR